MQHANGWMVGVRAACLAAPLLLAGLVLVSSVWAAEVTVSCPGQSLQDAINPLDRIGPHTITVTGLCTERIRIEDRDRLTIEAPPDQTATIASPTQALPPVVNVLRSRSIVLRRLVITGGVRGVNIAQGSLVQIERARAENNTGAGVFVTQGSTVIVQGTSAEPVRLTNNNAGITVLDSVVHLAGFTTIENNAGFGLNLLLSAHFQVFGQGNVIRDNGAGIQVRKSNLDLSNTQISNNNGPGVVADFNGTVALANVTVTDNADDGVRIIRGAVAHIGEAAGLTAPNTLTGNGGVDLACDKTGLVVLVGEQTITNTRCNRIEH